MRINKRLFTGLILTLAGTLIWANVSWGQGPGQGQGRGKGPGGGGLCVADPANPGVCRVPGSGPNQPGNPNRPQRQGPRGQGRQGQGGPGQNVPNPPGNPPPATQ